MTRVGYDSDVAANLPQGGDVYFGYVDGSAVPGQAQSYQEAKARFPGKRVLSISVTGLPADVGDVESGALTIQQAIQIGYVMVYNSLSNWAANIAAYAAAGKPQPLWWVASYGALPDPSIPAGAAAHQYTDGTGAFDTSSVIDFLPGIDRSDEMLILTTAGQPALLVANGVAVGLPTLADEAALNAVGVPSVAVSTALFESVFQASNPQLKATPAAPAGGPLAVALTGTATPA